MATFGTTMSKSMTRLRWRLVPGVRCTVWEVMGWLSETCRALMQRPEDICVIEDVQCREKVDTCLVEELAEVGTSIVDRYGIPWFQAKIDSVDHDEVLFLTARVAKDGRALYIISYTHDHVVVDAERQRALTGWLVELGLKSRAHYGFAGGAFSSKETRSYLHDPILGPSRLEWVNWFDAGYESVFGEAVLRENSEIVTAPSGDVYYLVKMTERLDEYGMMRGRLRERALRRRFGLGNFSIEGAARRKFFAAMSYHVIPPKPAKRIPAAFANMVFPRED